MSVRGEDRKAAIVTAAIERLARLGFEGLRVRDVAQDVGINNATLHHHFPTKAHLVAAIVERFLATFRIEGAPPAVGTMEERLAAHQTAVRDMMRRSPDTFVVLNELMVRGQRDDDVARLMAGAHDSWRNHLVDVCRNAGADTAVAIEAAERCRRELLGLSLDLSARRDLG